MVVAPRDFIMYSEIPNWDPNPTEQTIITFSVDIPEAPTPAGKIVWANLLVGGWVLEKINPYKTKAIYVSMSDIKGNIPKFVITMGVGQITQTVVKLI